jgi:adenylate kinase family enzyme
MKVAIIGNSGSGKSTLARALAASPATATLDLDIVFWEPDKLEERPSADRIAEVQRFCHAHDSWIIEGCYTDLIEVTFPWDPELIFLDLGQEICVENCRRRPHEPHKFTTKEDQDEKLDFLIKWVSDYYHRDGLISYDAHNNLFDRYEGPKRRIQKQNSPTLRSTKNLPASCSVLLPLRSAGTDHAPGRGG